MIFYYKGIDRTGKRLKSVIEAASLEEAKSRLKAQQIIYEWIEEKTPSLFEHVSLQRRYKITARDLSTLSKELAVYIRSGITIVSALKILQTHYEGRRKLAQFLSILCTYLEEGKNFYTALETQKVVQLPEFYKQSIRVSEASGALDEVLDELSRFLKEQDRIAKEVRSAFAYPAFMLVVSLFMVAFMLTFVVPQITAIFTDMDQELPVMTQVVIQSGDFFREHHIALLLSVLFAAGLFQALRHFNAYFRYITDRILLTLPLFGPIVMKNELGRFTYVGALLVRSGIPFVQTIDLSAKILGNRVLSKSFSETAEKVVEGTRFSSALYQAKTPVDHAFIQAIALGEETSQVEPVLSNLSELYFEENRDRIRLVLNLLEPTLMLLVGGLIGLIVAAMLLPIFSMSVM